MMKLNILGVVASLFLAAASAAHADLVAYWNFNNLSTTGGVPSNANQTAYAPTQGTGSLNLVGWTSRAGTSPPHGISNFGGSTINSLNADPSGQSLALQAGTTSGTPNNGASAVFSFSLTGLLDPTLSFATQRTGTGFNSIQLAYSTDGTNYTDFGSPYNPATSFALQSFDLSSIDSLDNQASVFLRLTFAGATASAGNNRLDNIQINAIAIPEPASVAGLLLLGLTATTRMRRRR